MDIEAFEYSVATAIIGMGVVFLSLGILSILMYLLRIIVEGRAGKRTDSVARSDDITERALDGMLPREVIFAAAACYLDYESRARASSAEAWTTQ